MNEEYLFFKFDRASHNVIDRVLFRVRTDLLPSLPAHPIILIDPGYYDRDPDTYLWLLRVESRSIVDDQTIYLSDNYVPKKL